MSSSDKYIDRLSMPKSAIDAMAKTVPDDVVKAIVQDNRRATPNSHLSKPKQEPEPPLFQGDPSIPPGQVRVLTGEALDRWFVEREAPGVQTDYDPFSNAWICR